MRGVARAAAVLVALAPISATARAGDDRLQAADECARITAEGERLRCFDGVFGGRNVDPHAAAPTTAREAEFGLTDAQKQAANPQSAEAAEPDEVTTRVARVIPRGMEPPVLELENGQQWRLLESMANVRFRAGDAVVIRRGSLGSYLISNPDRNGSWRVRRMR